MAGLLDGGEAPVLGDLVNNVDKAIAIVPECCFSTNFTVNRVKLNII